MSSINDPQNVDDAVAAYLAKGEAAVRTYELAKATVERLRAEGHPEAEWSNLGRWGMYIIFRAEEAT